VLRCSIIHIDHLHHHHVAADINNTTLLMPWHAAFLRRFCCYFHLLRFDSCLYYGIYHFAIIADATLCRFDIFIHFAMPLMSRYATLANIRCYASVTPLFRCLRRC